MRAARCRLLLFTLAGLSACTHDKAREEFRALLAESVRRGDSAAPLVDTIVARPNPLHLYVGDTVRVSFTAMDSTGDTLTGFVPLLYIEDQAILFRAGFGPNIAIKPGRTRIRVTPHLSRYGWRNSDAATYVLVEVEPRAPN